MKKELNTKTYYFVDESGDDIFFDKFGRNLVDSKLSSPLLIIGYIETTDPKSIRNAFAKLRETIINDDYLKVIPSWKKSIKSFHAKDDTAEIREKVFKLIKEQKFKAQVIVARKIESIFRKQHNSNPENFYHDLITKLFKNRLHLNTDIKICFSKRGKTTKDVRLKASIDNAVGEFESKWKSGNHSNIQIYTQKPSEEQCLQLVDYILWAVQRLLVKNDERYFKFIEDKYSLIWDLYDFKNYNRPHGGTLYTKLNVLEKNKISPI